MPSLYNGRWKSKTDPTVTLVIEKTYKKGYVTGFSYCTLPDGRRVHGKVKLTFSEIEQDFRRS